MNRKKFIIITSAGVAAVTVPIAWHYLEKPKIDPMLTLPRSLSLIWERDSISAVGRRYRKLIPAEDSEQDLIRLLSNPSHGREASKDTIEREVTNDFETGDTVVVDGWILSHREARQCALFSINQNK